MINLQKVTDTIEKYFGIETRNKVNPDIYYLILDIYHPDDNVDFFIYKLFALYEINHFDAEEFVSSYYAFLDKMNYEYNYSKSIENYKKKSKKYTQALRNIPEDIDINKTKENEVYLSNETIDRIDAELFRKLAEVKDKEDFLIYCYKFLEINTIWDGRWEIFNRYNIILELIEEFTGDDRLTPIRHYLYTIYERFHILFDNDDARKLNIKFQTKLVEDKQREPISRDEIFELSSKLFGEENQELLILPFRGKWFEVDKYNNNGKMSLLKLSSLMYGLARIESEEGRRKNNTLIEYMIKDAEDIIDYIMLNHDKFSIGIYVRLISLISAKNNIKIRYNQDNNLWDTEELINTYLIEVLFYLNHNYHLTCLVLLHKLIDDIAKIQNYYNDIGSEFTVKDIYERLICKLEIGNHCMVSNDSIFWGFVPFDKFEMKFDQDKTKMSIDDLMFIKSVYKRQVEDLSSRSKFVLFNPKYFESKDALDIEYLEKAKDLIELEWNMFKDNKSNIIKNIIDTDFIY